MGTQGGLLKDKSGNGRIPYIGGPDAVFAARDLADTLGGADVEHRGCGVCSAPIPPLPRNRKWCSRRCARVGEKARWKARATHVATCKGCGLSFSTPYPQSGASAQTFCTLECQWTWKRVAYRAPAKACRLCARSIPKVRVCFCSDRCHGIYRRLNAAQRPGRWVAGTCGRCGSAFVVRAGGRPSFCSPRCRNGVEKERHRARRRDAYVEPVNRMKVFERDGWVCQLCLKPVRRSLPSGHMKEATVDHIVALAAGGAHCMANVQTAHRICNSLKGDTPGPTLALLYAAS